MTGTPISTFSVPACAVDLSENPHIPELASMLLAASSMTDPAQILSQFGPWVAQRAPRDAFVSISLRGLEKGQYKFTRILTDHGGRVDPSSPLLNPWKGWASLATHQGGLVWELVGTPEPKLLNHVDFTKDPILNKILGSKASSLHAVAALPAYEDGKAINWSLSFHTDPDWNNLDTFEMGFLDMNMMGTATRNLVTRKRVEELNSQLQEQLNQMGQIQLAMIPKSNPALDDYELASSYLPCEQAGGDFYNYLSFDGGWLGVMIADVTGHGPAAATVMAMLNAHIRAYGQQQAHTKARPDPAETAKYLNTALLATPLPNMFATAFIAILDPYTGTINWTRCGHNPPRIRSVDGSIRTLTEPGTLPLGIIDDLPAQINSSTLAPGDTLVMYTDGITEAARPADNEAGFEMFGERRLDEALAKCSGQPECIIKSVNDALLEFTGTNIQNDDRTIVVVRHNHPDDPA